jgi:hypothetical protein
MRQRYITPRTRAEQPRPHNLSYHLVEQVEISFQLRIVPACLKRRLGALKCEFLSFALLMRHLPENVSTQFTAESS